MAEPGPPISRRERKKAQLRQALTEAAFRLFLEKGYNATTLEDIGDACDVTVQTLLRYFGTKEDLLFQRQADVLAAYQEGLAGAAEINNSIGYFLQFFRSSLEMLKNSDEFIDLYKIIEHNENLLSKFHWVIKGYEDVLEAALSKEQGVRAGDDLHSTLLAKLLVSGLLTESLRMIGQGEIDRLGPRTEEIIDYILRTFRRPVAA